MIRVLAPFFALPVALRQAGFAVAPDQTQSFIAAIGLLGPRGIWDVRQAALAVFAIPPERRQEFDAIFRAIFEGQLVAADSDGEDDDTLAVEPTGTTAEVEMQEADEPAGGAATAVERLGARDLGVRADHALEHFAREAPQRLPRRVSYRRKRSKSGDRIDLRLALRQAARNDGDVMRLPETRRKLRQRRIVLLVDVSGSMRDPSEGLLQVAHAVVQAADRAEVFTLGTRLTRITAALGPADRGAAMARVAQAVADIDGGTRIGEALEAFLNVPRYAGFARGALVTVLSDGLEQGDPGPMIAAVARLSRLAWRLHWLTPLAADPAFRPATAALKGILPSLDDLADGSDVAAVCDHLLHVSRAA